MAKSLYKVSSKVDLYEYSKITVHDALAKVVRQASTEGLRDATIRDYGKWLTKFAEHNKIKYVSDIQLEHIYSWLASMDVADSTRRIRLKALKAVLNRMLRLKLIDDFGFQSVRIKVNEAIKQGTTSEDIQDLLSHLDLTNFFHLRDATAILLIWHTGIRLTTLSSLRECHVDLQKKLLMCSGDIMKNHRRLVLPLPDKLTELLGILIKQNHAIADAKGFDTDLIFISKNGNSFAAQFSSNTFGKRLREYGKQFGIKNINAHAIRRGFSKRLLDEGVSIPVISKALGHSSISTTTMYLNIDEAELIQELKRIH